MVYFNKPIVHNILNKSESETRTNIFTIKKNVMQIHHHSTPQHACWSSPEDLHLPCVT